MNSTAKESRRGYWIKFLISFVLFAFLLVFANEWFWIVLPFMLTYLVQALDMM